MRTTPEPFFAKYSIFLPLDLLSYSPYHSPLTPLLYSMGRTISNKFFVTYILYILYLSNTSSYLIIPLYSWLQLPLKATPLNNTIKGCYSNHCSNSILSLPLPYPRSLHLSYHLFRCHNPLFQLFQRTNSVLRLNFLLNAVNAVLFFLLQHSYMLSIGNHTLRKIKVLFNQLYDYALKRYLQQRLFKFCGCSTVQRPQPE